VDIAPRPPARPADPRIDRSAHAGSSTGLQAGLLPVIAAFQSCMGISIVYGTVEKLQVRPRAHTARLTVSDKGEVLLVAAIDYRGFRDYSELPLCRFQVPTK
jgi:hypothetical protein